MKKTVVILLAFALLLAACSKTEKKTSGRSSEKASARPMTFAEFDEKYRRADFDAFLKDPSEFLRDLASVNNYREQDQANFPSMDGWTVRHDSGLKEGETFRLADYQKECVLFNKPFSYSATAETDDKESTVLFILTVEFETGDVQKDLEIARALYFSAVSEYGDPEDLTVDIKDADEPAVLRILEGKDDPTIFSAYFKGGTSVSLFAIKHYDGTYTSNVDVCALPKGDGKIG